MEKRINLELRGRQPVEVKHLDLSGCKTGGDMMGLTDEYINLESLDLNNSFITSLKTFPKLKALKKVDLSGNRLTKGLEYLTECTNLNHIIINGNRFKELEVLEPLKSLPTLTHLELSLSVPSLTSEEYKRTVFEMLPSLKYLDQEDQDGNYEDEEEHVNGNGVADEDDDLDDGDDELEEGEEEVDEDDEEESDADEVPPGLDMFQTPLLNDDEEESEDDDASEEDEDLDEDSEEEEEESTRGKRSPTESTRGKKRKLDDEDLDAA